MPYLEAIATRLNIDQASVMMLYTKAKGVIAVGSSADEKHLKELVALDAPEMKLTEQEVEELEQVGKTVYFRAYDEHMTEDFPTPQGLMQ